MLELVRDWDENRGEALRCARHGIDGYSPEDGGDEEEGLHDPGDNECNLLLARHEVVRCKHPLDWLKTDRRHRRRTPDFEPEHDRQQPGEERREAREEGSAQSGREATAELLPPEDPIRHTVAHICFQAWLSYKFKFLLLIPTSHTLLRASLLLE